MTVSVMMESHLQLTVIGCVMLVKLTFYPRTVIIYVTAGTMKVIHNGFVTKQDPKIVMGSVMLLMLVLPLTAMVPVTQEMQLSQVMHQAHLIAILPAMRVKRQTWKVIVTVSVMWVMMRHLWTVTAIVTQVMPVDP